MRKAGRPRREIPCKRVPTFLPEELLAELRLASQGQGFSKFCAQRLEAGLAADSLPPVGRTHPRSEGWPLVNLTLPQPLADALSARGQALDVSTAALVYVLLRADS